MRALLSKLTYANVIATLALFLALGGGAVWAAGNLGKNAVKTQNIAKNAVKSGKIAAGAVKNKQLHKNAVTGGKVKKGTLTRSKLKTGTLAGLQVIDLQAPSVPGLTTVSPSRDFQGTPVPLVGPKGEPPVPTFIPNPGKSYQLLAELRGTPSDADGGGPHGCEDYVQIYVNGEPFFRLYNSADESRPAPYNVEAVGTASTALGLLTAGVPQTFAANAFGVNDFFGPEESEASGCGPTTTGVLRISVVELG
jgi:hypothetical protein